MPSKKRKLLSTNTTGYRGVSKRGERFQAQICINDKLKYLGTYETPQEAAVAYSMIEWCTVLNVTSEQLSSDV